MRLHPFTSGFRQCAWGPASKLCSSDFAIWEIFPALMLQSVWSLKLRTSPRMTVRLIQVIVMSLGLFLGGSLSIQLLLANVSLRCLWTIAASKASSESRIAPQTNRRVHPVAFETCTCAAIFVCRNSVILGNPRANNSSFPLS